MINKNARVIIPLAVGVWLLSIVAFSAGLPTPIATVLTVVLILTMAVGVPLVVFYLMAEAGWSTLAKRFKATSPYSGKWVTAPTLHMATVSVDDPEYQRSKARFNSTVSVGVDELGLGISMLFGRIPVLGPLFFPTVRMPWSEITSARKYEAPGWIAGKSAAGISATFDPNYTGEFVEIVVGDPQVFIQLPPVLLGEYAKRLPLAG